MKKFLLGLLFWLTSVGLSAQTVNYIDVLVVYTPALVAYIPQPQLDTWIAEQFPVSNQVFNNNELPIQLRLVGTYMTTYTELEGDQAVNNLYRLYFTNDGYMDDVHTERDRVYADVVIYLTQQGPNCGSAMGELFVSNPQNFAPYAFAEVRTDCYEGSAFTLLHEIGHLMGLSHEVAQQPTAGWDTGHAYKVSNSFYTVMTNSSSSAGLVPYFSSATRLDDQGRALGNATKANAEEVLRTTGPIVAGFRTPPGC